MSGKSVCLQRRLAQRRGRVVHRERQRPRGAGCGVGGAEGAVDLPDPRPGLKRAIEKRPEGDHQGRVERLELARQERRAGGDLVGLRVAVVRRAALDDVRDEDLLARPADRRRAARRGATPACPTNGRPCRSSLKPGPSPTKTTSVAAVPSPGTARVRPSCSRQRVQAATSARDRVERRLALGLGHEASPAPLGAARRERALTQPRSRRTSAISTAFVAAPLRRLSLTTQKARPRSGPRGPVRTRPT